MNTKLSSFDSDEKVVSAVGALISPQVACSVRVPVTLMHRAIYLFLEAIPTLPAEDFELEAEIQLFRNGSVVHVIPASIAENANGAGIVTASKLTAFANVSTGQNENLFATLSSPLTNGQTETVLSPQKLEMECDEVVLAFRGSKNTGNSFSGWRALLAVRSSLVPL